MSDHVPIYTPYIPDGIMDMFGEPTVALVSDEQKALALKIVAADSDGRISSFGGYPDKCAFVGEYIVIASVDGNEPHLTVALISDYVAKWFFFCLRRMTMSEIKSVSLGSIFPNPHRNLETYPWVEAKVEQLKRSISDVGFWAGVIARPIGRRYELAFGHHRIEAARRLGLKDVKLILEPLSDQQMLQFMGRENGEDYSTDFLVMLNTWDGAVSFLANSATYGKQESIDSQKPISKARLLGWTSFHNGVERMSVVAAACSAAFSLISGGYLARNDLRGLSVNAAREIVVRAQERIEQLEKIGRREGHRVADTERAQRIVGKAAKATTRDARDGRVAQKDLRSQVDLNTLRAAGASKPTRSPLFSVFGQALCDSVAKMLANDSASERINEIEKVMGNIELDEDLSVIRKLHHELDELSIRSQRAKKRTTPNKIVQLKAIGRDV